MNKEDRITELRASLERLNSQIDKTDKLNHLEGYLRDSADVSSELHKLENPELYEMPTYSKTNFWQSVKDHDYKYIKRYSYRSKDRWCDPEHLQKTAIKFDKPWRFEWESLGTYRSRKNITFSYRLTKIYSKEYVESKIKEES